jgi:hypothetical protein
MKAVITFIVAACAWSASRGELVILQDPSHSPVPRLWTNATDGLRVIDFKGGADWRDYTAAGHPRPANWPAIVDTDTGVVVDRPTSVQAARQQIRRLETDDVPERVRSAREKLDAIGLGLGVTNEQPSRIVARVMRANTNAANATLRAEAVHAYWTIRDYRLTRRLKLNDENEGD